MTDALITEIRQTLWQYQSDLIHPVTDDGSRQRRQQHIKRLLAKLDGAA